MEVCWSELIPVNLWNLGGEVVGGTGVLPGSTDDGASEGKRIHSPLKPEEQSRKTHPLLGTKLRKGLVLMRDPNAS